MFADWKEQFSKKHILNSKIKDADLFLHGTSSKKYLSIQRTGFLLRNVPARNWSISRKGVCFEKYLERGNTLLCRVVDLTIKDYYEATSRNDGSSEGVVLQIKGRELKKLSCPIYADWNKNFPLKYDSEGIPYDVDSSAELLSIIVDGDIPLRYLKLRKKVKINRDIDDKLAS
jgi:hypothetical protein